MTLDSGTAVTGRATQIYSIYVARTRSSNGGPKVDPVQYWRTKSGLGAILADQKWTPLSSIVRLKVDPRSSIGRLKVDPPQDWRTKVDLPCSAHGAVLYRGSCFLPWLVYTYGHTSKLMCFDYKLDYLAKKFKVST